MNTSLNTARRVARLAAGATLLASGAAAQQVTFSIDWHSPMLAAPDSFTALPITEGDILSAATITPALGPLPPPGTVISAGPTGLGLPLWGACVGHLGGTPCAVEVDALSYGTDFRMQVQSAAFLGDYFFSTDEYALGNMGPFFPPDMSTEVPCGDASADVWKNAMPLPGGPLPPFAVLAGHKAVYDGDGMPSCSGSVYPGFGLREPNFPGFPNIGDNVDALDIELNPSPAFFPPTGVYFSLDEGYFDFLAGVPNSGSAPAHGFFGADILKVVAPGGPPVVWAPAPMLGLNLAGAVDDLDALAIWENGTGVFEPSLQPYDWLGNNTDMVLFSVRRGSAVIGMPDSIFGIPIEEGDILTTPLPTAFGGLSPFPGIFCAAENLGLVTARSTGAIGDDLNALDTVSLSTGTDCNGNGVPDSIDIASGASTDVNGNGIPDECELIASGYCYCPVGGPAPCANWDGSAGCRNSTGVGALLSGSGTSSVFNDDLVLTVSNMPTGQFGIVYFGSTAIGPFPFGDGLRCVGGGVVRFGPKNSGAGGSISYGPGLIGGGAPWVPFSTVRFQGWYRDPFGPCGNGFNLSNALAVTFTP
ncbi:MAG: hypothetical protein H6828_09130 [Planctomycetes bacterium]|nr:hypothetical protein [Planctomycetota bacterium]